MSTNPKPEEVSPHYKENTMKPEPKETTPKVPKPTSGDNKQK